MKPSNPSAPLSPETLRVFHLWIQKDGLNVISETLGISKATVGRAAAGMSVSRLLHRAVERQLTIMVVQR